MSEPNLEEHLEFRSQQPRTFIWTEGVDRCDICGETILTGDTVQRWFYLGFEFIAHDRCCDSETDKGD